MKCEVGRGKWGSNWVFSFRNWEVGSKKWDVGLIEYNLISARGGVLVVMGVGGLMTAGIPGTQGHQRIPA